MAPAPLLSAAGTRLEGKVAIITGGASGIGKCTAELFTQQGAKVVIADVQDELGRSVAEALGSANCSYVHCDVTDEAQIKDAVDKAVATYGKLDIMINNAGVSDVFKPRVVDNDKSDFERVMSVNVTGVFLGIKHASRVMIPARTGSIISTASLASFVGGLTSHAYCASKHAVVGLTRNAAVELGQFGVRVNCVSPYGVATPLGTKYNGFEDDEVMEAVMESVGNLKGVRLKARDVAEALLYLASDEAAYVSGLNLAVDGGFSVCNSAPKRFQYPQSSY